ncbi:MAG: FtsQ-type POTRA domain-containing protein [Azospirillum sp.]|nr:FtsQ-type POTRA domain-containing protein [Azospirillum sp.]
MSGLNPRMARKDSPALRAMARAASRSKRRHAWPRWATPILRIGGIGALCGAMVGGVFWLWQAGWLGGIATWANEVAIEFSANLGFRVSEVLVEGRVGADRNTLLSTLKVKRGDPIFGFSVVEARTMLEDLPWVAAATVERRLPDTIYVRLTERRPMALWQREHKLVLIDREGNVLADKGIEYFSNLPILVGDDAPARAPDLLAALAEEPQLAGRVEAAVRVGQRRWDVKLKSGITLRLPESDFAGALRRVSQLAQSAALFERDILVIDLRMPDRLIVQTATAPAQPAAKPRRQGEKI